MLGPFGVTAPPEPAGTRRINERTETQWVVTSTEATKQQREWVEFQNRSVTWNANTATWTTGLWQGLFPGTWSGWATLMVVPKPANMSEVRETLLATWTAWEVVGPAVFGCLWQQYQYQRYQLEHWIKTHYWGGSSWVGQWGLSFVLGEREEKTAIGSPVSFACPSSARDSGARGSSGDAGQFLLAGDYVFTWGGTSVSFTVPAGAAIELAWRVLDSGVRAAVLTDTGTGEVLVHPGAQAARGARGSGSTTDKRSASLKSIESSVAEAQSATATATATESSTCTAVSSDGSAAAIDLNADRCASVAAGGAVQITAGGSVLSLTLTADRAWLVARLGAESAGEPERVGLLDVASSSLLLLNAATGAEVERRIPDDAEAGIGALFDAIVTSVSRSDAPAGRGARGSDGQTGARSAGPQTSGTSVRGEEPATGTASTAEPRPCTVASSDGSSAAIDLPAGGCASVAAGSAVQITVGGDVLSLTLTADRDWIVTRVGADGAARVVLFDVASQSLLFLDPATGAEVERIIPDDAEAGIGALFDAIVTSATSS